MTIKKKTYKDTEIPIYGGEAILYLVGETWYYRCWLPGENKYARKSLRTKSREMAIERGKKQHHQLMADMDSVIKFIERERPYRRWNRTQIYEYFSPVILPNKDQILVGTLDKFFH